MTRRFASLCFLGVLASCSPVETGGADKVEVSTVASPVVSYANAFVMEPIGGRDMTMGGVTLSVSEADVTLVGATSPSIGTIELHTMSMTNGKMQMRQVKGFDIKAGETLELKRGGDHFMMFEVGPDVAGGASVDIALQFETADGSPLEIVVPAEVRVVGE